MAIDATYKEILVENYIKEELSKGNVVSATDVADYIKALESYDLTRPQFQAAGYYVGYNENSSVAKFRNTFYSIRQDVQALYREMLSLSDKAIRTYDRWNIEAGSIEKQLVNLEARIDNLLLLAQDTEGYHSVIIENFLDSSMVDLDLSSCLVDLRAHQCTLQPSSGTSNRLFMNALDPAKDISFRVRSTVDFLGRTDMVGAEVVDIFKQGSKGWWTSVSMKQAGPVTCELDVRLGETAVGLSKIVIELHDSAQSGAVQITPLYSVDNVNWSQFTTNTFTQEARTSCVFSFPETQVKWVKFILTKKGPDPGLSTVSYSYQFGFKEIMFFQEGFSANTEQQLISRPLWVVGTDGNPVEFERLTLQVCERVETNTKIKYYITTSNNSAVPIDEFTIWSPIAPLGSTMSVPNVLSVGDVSEYIYGATDLIAISYDGVAVDDDFKNPAQDFHLLNYNDITEVIDDTVVSTVSRRYTFKNNNERILNYQIDSGVGINPSTLQIFRNLGRQGLDETLVSSKVRTITRGWGFDDPWYYCVVLVEAPEGIEIDVGDSPISIDGVRYTGKVEKSILTGKYGTSTGLHQIRVHKDNWKYVAAGLNTLDELKAKDPLYPYNHRLLIEGYSYGGSFPTTELKVYTGVDLFAQYLMQEVAIFDFINNIPVDRYDLFTKDLDAPASQDPASIPSTVFMVKVDAANTDCVNERFMIKFKLINELRKYLRVRADLSTSDAKVTPAQAGYKIKIG
jgi:hypothetical protein